LQRDQGTTLDVPSSLRAITYGMIEENGRLGSNAAEPIKPDGAVCPVDPTATTLAHMKC